MAHSPAHFQGRQKPTMGAIPAERERAVLADWHLAGIGGPTKTMGAKGFQVLRQPHMGNEFLTHSAFRM